MSLRNTSTATLTTANTARSSSDVVPPRISIAFALAKAALCVYSAAPAACVLGDQLQVAEGRHHRDEECDQKRKPRRTAYFRGDVTGERVDAGAEDVADDEQQEQPRAHHPFEFWFLLGFRGVRHGASW
jgi:hypothetical protein